MVPLCKSLVCLVLVGCIPAVVRAQSSPAGGDDSSARLPASAPVPVALKGVIVKSPLAIYRRDTAFNRRFFKKELAYAKFKPSVRFRPSYGGPMGFQLGAQWTGLISNMALVASGKKKAYKRLAKEMKYLERTHYSSIRYNADLVSSLTGLDDLGASEFVLRNPLPDEYLQIASDLELRMHIRELFLAQR